MLKVTFTQLIIHWMFLVIEVKRLNTLFEGTFNDLSFTQREILERARLRLNILKQTRCAQKFTLRLIDGETYQVIDEYILEAKHNGVNSIHLTSSLKKLVLAPSVNKSLRVKIVFNNSMSDKSLCNKTTSGIRKHVYLVTHTKEKNPRRYRLRRSPKNRNLPSSPKTCTMQNVYVNLRHLNNTVVAPPGFTTGLCGTWQPIPIGADPIIKRVAKAVYKATRSLPQVSNPKCCIPTAFNRLPILYLDSMSHSVLRYLDKVLVTKCGCPSKT